MVSSSLGSTYSSRPSQFARLFNDTSKSQSPGSSGPVKCNVATQAIHLQSVLRMLSCHRQNADCPKSRLTHLPGSQQMHCHLLELAGHL